MKLYRRPMYALIAMCFSMLFLCPTLHAQEPLFTFGQRQSLQAGSGATAPHEPLCWIDVNTSNNTWHAQDSILTCLGLPIGVVRSEHMYENFILQVQWRHLEKGGNSGIFIWCDAVPEDHNRLPSGVEVQMLELDWVNQNLQQGQPAPIAYVHGELFGAGKTRVLPDNPRGERSKSLENRCLEAGQWNSYTVVCVDGTVKLSVNGKFVNGIRQSSQRKGYLCLEAEGAKIEFKNLQLIELPPSHLLPEHIVAEL